MRLRRGCGCGQKRGVRCSRQPNRSVRRHGERRAALAAIGAEIRGIKKRRAGRVQFRQKHIAAVYDIAAAGEGAGKTAETRGSRIARLVRIIGDREVRGISSPGDPRISAAVHGDGARRSHAAGNQGNGVEELLSVRAQFDRIHGGRIRRRGSGAGKRSRRRRKTPDRIARNISRARAIHLDAREVRVGNPSKKRGVNKRVAIRVQTRDEAGCGGEGRVRAEESVLWYALFVMGKSADEVIPVTSTSPAALSVMDCGDAPCRCTQVRQ